MIRMGVNMGVFISWSGERSNLIAEYLRQWLMYVLQACDPWLSSQDIENGSIWNNEINEQLQAHTMGIICLTKENLHAPWILFEAGALAKGLKTSRVYTLLIELKPEDIDSPLDQFNHTFANDEQSMFNMIVSINHYMKKPLDHETLKNVFKKYWGDFEDKYNEIIKDTLKEDTELSPKKESEILKEILFSIKQLSYKVNRLEGNDKKTINNKNERLIRLQKPYRDIDFTKRINEVIGDIQKSVD